MPLSYKKVSGNRGETIVAVALAISLFTAVAISSIAFMNRGLAINQRSVEIMQVGNAIAAQADMLRFVNEKYAVSTDKWPSAIINATTGDLFPFYDTNSCPVAPGNMPAKWFVMAIDDEGGANKFIKPYIFTSSELVYSAPSTFSKVDYIGDISNTNKVRVMGLWIEAVKIDSLGQAIDFHIRACWDSPGNDRPVKLDTVVRLYDPT